MGTGWMSRMTMTCPSCAEANTSSVLFCVFCGQYLGWDEDSNVSRSTESSGPVGPQPAVAEEPFVRQTATDSTTPHVEERDEQPVVPTRSVASTSCPACGRTNDSTHRFCAKCGHQFNFIPASSQPIQPRWGWRSWWARLRDPHDRASRRAYRRALPAVYRWRRVLIALLVGALIVAAGYVTDANPGAWARDRWSDIFYRNRLVEVLPNSVSIEPANATAKGSPDMLVDNDADAWSMKWTKDTEGCRTPGTGVITLTIEPAVRVRQIIVYPGLQNLKARGKEFRPRSMGVAYGEGDPCASEARHELQDKVGEQTIEVDSKHPVTAVHFVVLTARSDSPKAKRLSITEIRVLTRLR